MSHIDENPRAVIGGNAPPDPIADIQAAYDDLFQEVANWLDGTEVQTDAQMDAVNELLASVKACEKEAESAKEAQYRPHKAAGDAVVAAWKPFLADLALQRGGLIKAVDAFKRKLAAEKDAIRKAAERDAWEKTRAAQEAARLADATNIEATRAAAAAMDEAEAAQKAAMAASKDTVKGMRTVTRYEILDHRALLNFIAKNARDDMTAFIEAWAAKNHKQFTHADGLKVWTEKEAF
jgi:uncharacterized protein YhaN